MLVNLNLSVLLDMRRTVFIDGEKKSGVHLSTGSHNDNNLGRKAHQIVA